MFYVAYFKKGVPSADRPITFLYNGGPGSSTVWLHMGAFGPRRVVTADDTHTPGRALLVWSTTPTACSTPATWCSSTRRAPASPASPARTRRRPSTASTPTPTPSPSSSSASCPSTAAGTRPSTCSARAMARRARRCWSTSWRPSDDVDFNGVILLSQILNFDLSADGPEFNPGTDEPYIIALPTYAATAWYHNLLPGGRPADLEAFLKEVEHFATGDYAQRPAGRRRASTRPSARRSPSSSPSTPACRSPTSSRPTCGSTAASSRRPCRTSRASPPAGSTRASPAPTSIR